MDDKGKHKYENKQSLLAAVFAVLCLGLFTGSVQAGRDNNPMAECLACGEALLLCGEGVVTQAFEWVQTCAGDSACVQVCFQDAKAGGEACESSYEGCKKLVVPLVQAIVQVTFQGGVRRISLFLKSKTCVDE